MVLIILIFGVLIIYNKIASFFNNFYRISTTKKIEILIYYKYHYIN